MNETWRRANVIPSNAAIDQRLTWDFERTVAFACRAIPARVPTEMARRGITPPAPEHR